MIASGLATFFVQPLATTADPSRHLSAAISELFVGSGLGNWVKDCLKLRADLKESAATPGP
jgi:hypothetical protein